MSKVKVTLPGLEIPVTGKQVSFAAPCDCSSVECIQIDGVDYTVVDALGNKVTGRPSGGAWVRGAQVSVILDCENKKAYLQGGAEVPITRKVNGKELSSDVTLSAADVGTAKVYRSLSELGLNESTATPQAIVDAMDDYSILLCPMSGTANTSALATPKNYMMLTVTKLYTSYAEFTLRGRSTDEILGYYGYYNSGAGTPWSGWVAPYSEHNKPSASDVGALNIYTALSELGLSEDTATMGDIVTKMDNNSMLIAGYGEAGANAGLVPVTYGLLKVTKRYNSYAILTYEAFNPDAAMIWEGYYNDGTSQKWSGWHKIATTNYALPRDGSAAMTGDFIVKKAENGYGAFFKNHSASADYGTCIKDVDANGKEAALIASAKDSKAYFNDGTVGWRELYHTGNKPTAEDVGALPIGGGEIEGDLKLKPYDNNKESSIIFYTERATAGGGGWAIYPIQLVGQSGGENTRILEIGAFGSDANTRYVYFGSNAYDSTDNIRLYPDGKVEIQGNEALHTGNMDSLLSNNSRAKVATGSYVGTGTFGADNPMSIVCGFTPKLVAVYSGDGRYGGTWVYGAAEGAVDQKYSNGVPSVPLTWNADGVSWYWPSNLGMNDDDRQKWHLNITGKSYHWTAIG